MKLAINRNQAKKAAVSTLLILLVWINSGSAIQAVNASLLQKLLCIICLLMFIFEKGHNKLSKLPKNATGICLIMVGGLSLICMFQWLEFSQIFLYFSAFSAFYICYIITKYIDMHDFFNVFIKFITFIAIVSLIGWLFTDFLLSLPIGVILNKDMNYKSFFIFNIITTAPGRNTGAFWEPGMFQGFLNFALLLIVMKKKNDIKDLFRIVIFVLAIITTYSTTGYFTLVFIFLLFVYRRIHTHFNVLANLLLVLFALAFIIVDGYQLLSNFLMDIYPNDIFEKIANNNISYTTRVYSILYDIIISIRNPFGLGRLQFNSEISKLIVEYGFNVNARTSTLTTAFINYGFIFGFYYFTIWIIACFKIAKRDLGNFIIIAIIMMMILNSEPMFFHLFMNCVLFYWLQYSKKRLNVTEK